MKATTRRLALVMVAGVLVLVGTLVWNSDRRDSPAQQQTIGLEEVKLACYDVRMASTYAEGPYPGMAAGVLDVAVRLTLHASQLSPDWTELNTAVQQFHTTSHSGDGAQMLAVRQASLDACQDIPDPVFPGQPSS